MGLVSTYCGFLLILNFAFGSAASIRDNCESDYECMPGYFCYTPTKYCSPCTDCASYNRNRKIWPSCAKTPSECGSCLQGYEEDILVGGNVRDWCISSPLLSAQKADNDKGQNSVHIGWLIGLGLLVVLFVCAAFSKSFKSAFAIHRLPEAPPSYTSACTSDPLPALVHSPALEVENVGNLNNQHAQCSTPETTVAQEYHQTWHQPKESSSLQLAVPFRLPNDSQHFSALFSSDEDESGNSDVDNVVEHVASESNIELEDETTMPSDWTPYPLPESFTPIQESECHNDTSNASCSDVVDSAECEDAEEPLRKKRKEDSDDQTADKVNDNKSDQ